jgi:hypothetical protein
MRRALLLLALAPTLAGCDLHSCANRPLLSVAAPDGRHVAAVFERACGATTGFSMQVSLIDRGESPAGAGNILILGEGEPVPRVEWLGPDRLLITTGRGARTFLHESERDGVRIEYRVLG